MTLFRDQLAHPLGVAIGDLLPPEQIPQTARWIEQAGFSHLTIPEDLFYLPAHVSAMLALSATDSLPVGTSLVSAVTRHPAVLAMEVAGISRVFRDRFWPAVGLGLPAWLEQMGLIPEKPVAAMREAVTALRSLLAGETVNLAGKEFTLREIAIEHAAPDEVPITMGVMSPMMLRLAGEVADATLFAASSGLAYFERAIASVRQGLRKGGRDDEAMAYRTIAIAAVDRDGSRARSIARGVMSEFLAEFAEMSPITIYGIGDELADMLKRGQARAVADEMPERWLEDLALVGTPREVAEKVVDWVCAGLDTITIFLPHESERETLTLVAEEVVPLVMQSSEWRSRTT